MLVIDGERNIRLRNAAASALLARQDLLLDSHGALKCRDRDSDGRLADALRSLARDHAPHRERGSLWLRGVDGRCAAATLHALREEAGREKRRPRVLVTVFEPGVPPEVDPKLLAMTYGLTAAEARLAALLACGKTTARCSKELDVKTSTLRSHLSAIYRKTGTHGKADLVRVVLSLCAI
ncbi:MAG TPA: LuxR C-terminal-related transcriptional regulator [Usitatibacter sp.]|nr:LuxR C-terminal-related transcriptional regulator [Usitatibacter sp.]